MRFARSAFLASVTALGLGRALPALGLTHAADDSDSHDGCDVRLRIPTDRPLELRCPVLDGPDFALSSYRGRVVWLNFFATWCPPCNDEMGDILAIRRSTTSSDLAIVGFNVAEEDDTVRHFRRHHGVTYPIAMDRSGGYYASLGLHDYPVSLFIGRDGRFACGVRGSMSEAEMRAEIERLVAPRPAATAALS